jgi:hypothetical protein
LERSIPHFIALLVSDFPQRSSKKTKTRLELSFSFGEVVFLTLATTENPAINQAPQVI